MNENCSLHKYLLNTYCVPGLGEDQTENKMAQALFLGMLTEIKPEIKGLLPSMQKSPKASLCSRRGKCGGQGTSAHSSHTTNSLSLLCLLPATWPGHLLCSQCLWVFIYEMDFEVGIKIYLPHGVGVKIKWVHACKGLSTKPDTSKTSLRGGYY